MSIRQLFEFHAELTFSQESSLKQHGRWQKWKLLEAEKGLFGRDCYFGKPDIIISKDLDIVEFLECCRLHPTEFEIHDRTWKREQPPLLTTARKLENDEDKDRSKQVKIYYTQFKDA